MIPNKILFCADFSEHAERTRRIAISYAKTFKASLLVLNVVNARLLNHPALVDLPVYEEAVKSVHDAAKESLEALGELCRKDYPNVTIHTRTGMPAKEIVEFAREESIDLIIMGTHGRTGLGHLLVGSTAETVVRTADCAVMTVRT